MISSQKDISEGLIRDTKTDVEILKADKNVQSPLESDIVALGDEVPPTTKGDVKKKTPKDHFWSTIFIFIFIVAVLRIFVIDPFLVHGSSMEPTFDDANYVIVDKFTYKTRPPIRGEVVVFDAPTDDGRYFIKRVIGLPGERVYVEGSTVIIYNNEHPEGFKLNEPYIKFQSTRNANRTLGENEYFVMGDNREVSSDSRIWGALKKDAITGRVLLRLLPVDQTSVFPGSIDEFPGVIYPKEVK